MPKLVLIIDDNPACAEILQIALESIPGIETRIVSNARTAIATLRQDQYEIAAIVTDLNMPYAGGLDLIRELRAEPKFARLPILLISGDSDPRLPERALAEGADAFFSKPYSPSAVRRKLEQLLC